MDTPLKVTTWANAAAAERRQNPGGPRPQTQIPSAVMLDFGGWRLLPPATIEAETNWEETPRWSLERPFEFAGQRLLVRYPIEAAFLGDDGLCTGRPFDLVVTVATADDGGPLLELVSARRLDDRTMHLAPCTGEMAPLLAAIKERMPELEQLWEKASSRWGYEDPIYRFYHGSHKTYSVQQTTVGIYRVFQSLMPDRWLDFSFAQIVRDGTGRVWDRDHNARWRQETRPQLEAFFHARHVLEMVIKYGRELSEPPNLIPSGWGTVLHIWGLRYAN